MIHRNKFYSTGISKILEGSGSVYAGFDFVSSKAFLIHLYSYRFRSKSRFDPTSYNQALNHFWLVLGLNSCLMRTDQGPVWFGLGQAKVV